MGGIIFHFHVRNTEFKSCSVSVSVPTPEACPVLNPQAEESTFPPWNCSLIIKLPKQHGYVRSQDMFIPANTPSNILFPGFPIVHDRLYS